MEVVRSGQILDILKAYVTELIDELNVEVWEKGVEDDLKTYDPSSWKGGVAIYWNVKAVEKSKLAGLKDKSSVLNLLWVRCLLEIQMELLSEQMLTWSSSL